MFEATNYEIPEEEKWLIAMAENTGVAVLSIISPTGETLRAAVHLTQYSSTMDGLRPYFEFSLRGVVVKQK